MSVVNDSNYPAYQPVAADYTIFVRDSDGVMRTATMQILAELFASLASLNLTVTVIGVTTTLTTEQLVVANSGSAIDLDLPASSLNTGRTYRVYNQGAGAVTLDPNGSDTIGGAASLVLAQGESVIITSDGLGNWTTFGAP
jgi:hypothetical protein